MPEKVCEDTRVLSCRELAPHTHLLRLHAPMIARSASPGQFVMLQVREGSDPLLRRPFSFHRIHPEEGVFEILFRVVGRGTWWLSRCRPEARLNLIGPLGNSFKLQPSNTEPIFLVAGGIGIAPLFELISRLVEGRETDWARESLHLFYGARTASELLPRKIFEDLGISINISTDDGSAGYHGYVTRLFQRVAMERGLRPAVLYACGPLAMQYHVSKWTIANGVPSQLSLESLMACGVGACLGCALPSSDPTDAEADHYVHVCKDGPIFSAESIQWNKIQKQLMQPPTFLFS